jgi:hypothetical protein
MHGFDEHLQVQQLTSIPDYLEWFIRQRLVIYDRRKLLLLHRLRRRIAENELRWSFVQDMLSQALSIWGKPKADALDLMKQRYSAHQSTLEELEIEWAPFLQDLLRTPLHQFTQEHVEELQRECATAQAEKKRIEGETAASIWLRDLDELEHAFHSWSMDQVKPEQNQNRQASDQGQKKRRQVRAKRP